MSIRRLSFVGYELTMFEDFKLVLDRMGIAYFAGEDWLEVSGSVEDSEYVERLVQLTGLDLIVGKWD